ncbi:hypothetical protein B0H13DRAFT_1913496 [Mycena leptocephala]|nr:hypothetical protein B0H13DRAFT_1913496 [Mycena leptocephala]
MSAHEQASVAVNDRAQRKLDRAAKPTEQDSTESTPEPNSAGRNIPEQDSDASEDEDDDIPLSNGVPPKMRRDPWLTFRQRLLPFWYCSTFDTVTAIVFPTFIGLFLFTCNAHKDVFSLLGRVGFSVGYNTIPPHNSRSSEPSSRKRNLYAAGLAASLGRRDTLTSGTAATLVGLEDITAEAMDSGPLLKNVEEKKRKEMTVDQLVKDIDWSILKASALVPLQECGQNISLLCVDTMTRSPKNSGSLTPSAVYVYERVLFAQCALQISMRLRQQGWPWSSIISSWDQLKILAHWLQSWLIMICGDQLSIDRVRKIKAYMGKGDTPFDRHDWALPPTGKDIFGLHHDVHPAHRDKFNPVKCDVYPAHHILEDRFEALMLDALRLLCEEKTGIVHPPKTPLIDSLEMYFNAKSDGPLSDIAFDELDTFSHTVYRRYMCNDAYEDAQGDFPRDPEVHGPQRPPIVVPVSDPQASVEEESVEVDSETEPMDTEPDNAKKGKGSRANKAQSGGSIQLFWEGSMLFDHRELHPDDILVLRFSFWGAGATNYGNEMLEMACNFLYEFPPALQDAVLNNYLVNTLHSFDSKHLSESVGLNIHGFSAVRDQFPRLFGFKKNDGTHKKADTTNDLNALGVSLPRRTKLWSTFPAAKWSCGGKLEEFLGAHHKERSLGTAENEPVPGDEERLPANPIASGTRGVTNLTQFSIGDSE